ncbi:uncharacterized protein PGTG_04674 [Puccinia graminis f. sp. tritici CRL 75-36-700-3]|uniref:Uncharacterized protein n=1 Tax=Puccinia graminis f. sp. tritici (strain CRL 75-36-700-3 / race SCCL) TaxID=418459 RepID=E3K3R6_PUCGT|nr:uncharacterized protein PGTG_04674 [Puccinia graminis f. sp. tritici CRL 75-36-700-3]EFP78718.2 hypothetical protein PGTG_04674 [Puccinia graminis f. sp. tritici CRL 75-36-700-3]
MEYNIHFISTSNVAGALEIAEPIVNQINELATDGSFAYDSTLQDEVLFMTVPLCFLADSPMAAEITNTPIPGGNCNNPCRMCHLGVSDAADRTGIRYIQQFFGIPHLPKPRSWIDTVQKTKNSWDILLNETKKAYEDHLTGGGLADKLQEELIERKRIPSERERINEIEDKEPSRLANPITNMKGFDGCRDTPVEILHVLSLGVVKYLVKDFMGKLKEHQLNEMEARLHSFCSDALHIPPIQAKYMMAHYKSFVGKDFRTIVQVAPFVFFPFMNQQQLDVWIPLCYICSMAFQTHIPNMNEYIQELEAHIKIFMYNIVKMTAQWANKPKFHMLLHLPASIKRYGPPCLFATEKFESFNGVVRHASIHSNRQSPGHDIAITFSNYQVERLLFSGAYLYDAQAQGYFSPSKNVTDVFSTNPAVQQAFGYNPSALSHPQYPCVKRSKVASADIEIVPDEIRELYKNYHIRQLSSLKLNDKESIRKGSFILVNILN